MNKPLLHVLCNVNPEKLMTKGNRRHVTVYLFKLNFLSFSYILISVRQKVVTSFDISHLWRSIIYTLCILTIIVCLGKCIWCLKYNFV